MTVGTNSYGTAAGTGVLTPRWSASGTFSASTNPTLATVESWHDEISALLNTVLKEYGFTIPVSQADARLMLNMFVQEEAAAMVEGVHGSGRFGPAAAGKGGINRFNIIRGDVSEFVKSHAAGIEGLGVPRNHEGTEIGFRETDESGNVPQPLFTREDYGESYKNVDV